MSADHFIGAWRLLSLEGRTSTGDVSYPFGKDAQGYLLYSREGYMSVSVMQARRVQDSGKLCFVRVDLSQAVLIFDEAQSPNCKEIFQ
jgi:hypothetical protein